MERQHRTWTAVLAAVPAAALVLSACSGDGELEERPYPPAGTSEEPGTPTATGTKTVTAAPGDVPTPRDCGDVGFEPGTDAGSFDVQATGVDCDTARRVAAAAEGAGGEEFFTRGFTCGPVGTAGELPSVVYRCEDESGAEVRFQSS